MNPTSTRVARALTRERSRASALAVALALLAPGIALGVPGAHAAQTPAREVLYRLDLDLFEAGSVTYVDLVVVARAYTSLQASIDCRNALASIAFLDPQVYGPAPSSSCLSNNRVEIHGHDLQPGTYPVVSKAEGTGRVLIEVTGVPL